MKENRKMIIILGVVLVFIVGIIGLAVSKGNKDEEILNEFYDKLNSRKYEIIYLAQTNCGYCKEFDRNLQTVRDVQTFDYLKINLDKILSGTVTEIFERFNIDTSEEISTPFIAIVKEGKIVENFGAVGVNELLETLKTYEIVDKDLDLGINYIELEDYLNIFQLGTKSIVAFSSVDEKQSETKVFKSVLKEIKTELNARINYMELTFDFEENYQAFAETFELIETEDIPIIAVIEDKKVIDYVSATTSKEKIIEMLKKHI